MQKRETRANESRLPLSVIELVEANHPPPAPLVKTVLSGVATIIIKFSQIVSMYRRKTGARHLNDWRVKNILPSPLSIMVDLF